MRRRPASALVLSLAAVSITQVPWTVRAEEPERDAAPPAEEAEAAAEAEGAGPWRQFRRDVAWLVQRPARWDRDDRRRALALAGATVGLYLLRDEIRTWAGDTRSTDRTDLAGAGRDLVGKGAAAPSAAALFWIASLATGERHERETAALLLESAAASAVVAVAGSAILGAERPEEGDGVRLLDLDGHGVSLDVALAASIVPSIRERYLRVDPGDGPARRLGKWAASAALYGGVALTALQRLDADKHWAPDVFLGAATGLGVGHTLVASRRRDERRPDGSLSVVPGGVALQLRFVAARAPRSGSPP